MHIIKYVMKPCSGKPSIPDCSHRPRWRARITNNKQVTYVCNSMNGGFFLCYALYCALLVPSFQPTDGTVGQLNAGVKIEEMHSSREKILCLCKAWTLAYSHTTHSTANYTFARDIYRAEHTAAIYSVSSSNLSYVGKDIV